MFPSSYENIISEMSLNVQTLQDLKCWGNIPFYIFKNDENVTFEYSLNIPKQVVTFKK